MVPIALMKLAEKEFPRLARDPVTRDQVWDVLEQVNSESTCADKPAAVRSELARLAGNGLNEQETAMIHAGRRIEAIKMFRARTGADLYTAKKMLDRYLEASGLVKHCPTCGQETRR